MAAFVLSASAASFMSLAASTSAWEDMILLEANLLSRAAEESDYCNSRLRATSFIRMLSTSIPLTDQILKFKTKVFFNSFTYKFLSIFWD